MGGLGSGRPSKFSREVADFLCERIMEGKSLRAACSTVGMPSFQTVIKWLASEDPKFASFREQYVRAREVQAELLADEMIEIADEATDSHSANAARVRVDTRKWVAAKLLPKKYGDRVAISGVEGDAPLEVVVKHIGAVQSACADTEKRG
jgi:hypothetical protein